MIPSVDAIDALARTRTGLHSVAEHVLAATQYRAAGTIRLRVVPGGFGTVASDPALAVVDGRLVVDAAGGTREAELTTLGDAAAFVGAPLGLPDGIYPPTTPSDPDTVLDVDVDAARELGRWFGVGQDALVRFVSDAGADAVPTLWPEHFDLGVSVDAVNYGVSPGDDVVAEPYLYVGPHAGPPRRDGFWNAPFGAALPWSEVGSVDDAVAFFARGRAEGT